MIASIRSLVLFGFAMSIASAGQSKTGNAKSEGPCSPSTSGNNNTITLNCTIQMVTPSTQPSVNGQPVFSDAPEYNITTGKLTGTFGEHQDSMCAFGTTQGKCPIRAVREKGALKIFATLYSAPGYGDVTLEGNVLHKKIAEWDRCFDDTSMEVVDENKEPVFQMIYTTPTDIVIRGIFRDHGETFVATSDLTGFYPPGFPVPQFQPLKALFKYPSMKSHCAKAGK